MPFIDTSILGAIAGATIMLGMPLARLRRPPLRLQGFLSALSIGVLLFLVWEVLSSAELPISASVGRAADGLIPWTVALGLVALLLIGFAAAYLSLVLFNQKVLAKGRSAHELPATRLALLIACGLGLHNFSEGLAIGQSSARGALNLALVLIVGFALHNITEAFGVTGPLTARRTAALETDETGSSVPSWSFLVLAGLIAGGPTFVGAMVGYELTTTPMVVLFLALAAGAIIYVLGELFNVTRRLGTPYPSALGLVTGFAAGYLTNLLLIALGA